MRLRPYIHVKDFAYVKKWVMDERVHSLWCANLISYPMTEEGLQAVLDRDSRD